MTTSGVSTEISTVIAFTSPASMGGKRGSRVAAAAAMSPTTLHSERRRSSVPIQPRSAPPTCSVTNAAPGAASAGGAGPSPSSCAPPPPIRASTVARACSISSRRSASESGPDSSPGTAGRLARAFLEREQLLFEGGQQRRGRRRLREVLLLTGVAPQVVQLPAALADAVDQLLAVVDHHGRVMRPGGRRQQLG